MSASAAPVSPFRGYRFPPDIISHAVWLYHRFSLSHRDVEEFGPLLASQLRRRSPRRGDTGAQVRAGDAAVQVTGEGAAIPGDV